MAVKPAAKLNGASSRQEDVQRAGVLSPGDESGARAEQGTVPYEAIRRQNGKSKSRTASELATMGNPMHNGHFARRSGFFKTWFIGQA
ncbi:hypothetical protein [Paenibacillus thalictri]|uniref:Uncharacterized protein n=1 Tax=Paenibacillus thalictri TaxID=2527873 RepID=A0A4Q9DK40_9BACL|nr:hypothetical protein [Paenibacillus thalictri]TBL72422.1 hypothetical protein EYB31_28995 [Paenibacillus thalictri]